jgi:hypothetical protein
MFNQDSHVPAEIQTENFPDTAAECYRYLNLLGYKHISVPINQMIGIFTINNYLVKFYFYDVIAPLAKAVAFILHRPVITYGRATYMEEGAMAILPTHNLSELNYVCLLSFPTSIVRN